MKHPACTVSHDHALESLCLSLERPKRHGHATVVGLLGLPNSFSNDDLGYQNIRDTGVLLLWVLVGEDACLVQETSDALYVRGLCRQLEFFDRVWAIARDEMGSRKLNGVTSVDGQPPKLIGSVEGWRRPASDPIFDLDSTELTGTLASVESRKQRACFPWFHVHISYGTRDGHYQRRPLPVMRLL
jgi:hypothetical protein